MDPGEIDSVLITHAHPDHVGGDADAEDRLVFPNARYPRAKRVGLLDVGRSFDGRRSGPHGMSSNLIATARKALDAITGRVTLVQGDEEVAPGIRLGSTPGHTPGHMMVTIAAGSQTVYHISDLVVHPLFVEHPEWAPAIDMDAGQANAVRRRFFARAAAENAARLRPSPRGRFPNLGRIAQWVNAWQWQPT